MMWYILANLALWVIWYLIIKSIISILMIDFLPDNGFWGIEIRIYQYLSKEIKFYLIWTPKEKYERIILRKKIKQEKQIKKDKQKEENIKYLEKIAELQGDKKFPEMNEVWKDIREMKSHYLQIKRIKNKY